MLQVLVAILQHSHKLKGHRTSGLLFSFWWLLTLCNIPQFISEINRNKSELFKPTWRNYHYLSCVIYFSLTLPISLNSNPEVNESILNRILFGFFDRTAWTGWKRPLTENDVFDNIPENTSTQIFPEFNKNFKKSQRNSHGNYSRLDENGCQTHGSIFSAMIKTFGGTFLLSNMFKLTVDMLQFASPLLLGALITFVKSDEALWKGMFLVFALFGLSLLIAVFKEQYALISFQVGMRIRTAVTNAVYRKALKISSKAKRNTSVGEIVNLMAVDANRLYAVVPCIPILFTGPVVAIIAILLLWQYIGVSVFSGLAVMIAMIPLSSFIAVKLKNLQISQMKVKDERVKSMNEILNGIKVFKLYAWEPSFETLVMNIRERELVFLKSFAIYNASTEVIFSLAPFLVGFFSYMTFVFVLN